MFIIGVTVITGWLKCRVSKSTVGVLLAWLISINMLSPGIHLSYFHYYLIFPDSLDLIISRVNWFMPLASSLEKSVASIKEEIIYFLRSCLYFLNCSISSTFPHVMAVEYTAVKFSTSISLNLYKSLCGIKEDFYSKIHCLN